MIEITRRLEFDAGHRVLNHEGKCRHLHGHRYSVLITVKAPELDNLGRVIDFSVVKEVVGGWIDSELDHNMILHPDDPLLQGIETEVDGKFYAGRNEADRLVGRHPYIMPASSPNPTAENLAQMIGLNAQSLLSARNKALKVVRLRIYETPNSYADWSPEEK